MLARASRRERLRIGGLRPGGRLPTPPPAAPRPASSIRSSSSRRPVPTHRSAIAFAPGARTGVRTIRMASEANTAPRRRQEISRPDRGPGTPRCGPQLQQQVASLRGHPRSGRVGRHAQRVDPAGRTLDHNRPYRAGARPHRRGRWKQVGGQDGFGLRRQEPPLRSDLRRISSESAPPPKDTALLGRDRQVTETVPSWIVGLSRHLHASTVSKKART